MRINKKKIKKEGWNILFDILVMIVDTLIIYFFFQKILLATSLLIIVSIIALIKWNSKVTWIIFFIAGIIGSSLESIIITSGAWKYGVHNFINIPIWLVVLWGITGASLYQLSLEIKRIGIKK